MVTEGIEFINADVKQVIDHLESVERNKLQISPGNIKINVDGKNLVLSVMEDGVKDYRIRKSFLHKLLKWYSFPLNQIYRLSRETVASVCNDYLMGINRSYVNVTIENGEALTITSPDYNEITDLEIIRKCAELVVRTVSRNDFMLRITTEEKFKFEAVPGDNCGMGINVINSETGFRTLSIAHFILRYVCTNGAIRYIDEQGGARVHYGHPENELQYFFEDQVKKALNSQIKLAESIKHMNDKNAISFVVGVSKRIESFLGKNESRNFLDDINDDSTLYDLFNLITDKANKYELSKRIYLETLAGDLILN